MINKWNKNTVWKGTVNDVFWRHHLCELVLSFGLDFCPPLPHKTYWTYFFKFSDISHIFLEYWLCLAAVTTGLVAVVLIFTQPIFWVGKERRDYIAGLALVITMQMGSWLQCILQSVAESKARLKTFAESSRCIQVRMLWCVLGGPVCQLPLLCPNIKPLFWHLHTLYPAFTKYWHLINKP